VRALEIDAAGGSAMMELATGERVAARLAERRYASRLMVGLPLSTPRRRTLLVTRDMLPADSFRRLRVWAIWGRLPAVAGKQLAA